MRRKKATPNELIERLALLDKGLKFCTKCESTKAVSDFYKGSSTYDGLSTACKDCKREYQRKYTREGRHKNRRNKYAKNNRGKILRLERNYRRSHRVQTQAKNRLNAEIRLNGFPHISTRRCSVCGDTAAHYHHWSYEEIHWLDVIPLCQRCHIGVHNGTITELEGIK